MGFGAVLVVFGAFALGAIIIRTTGLLSEPQPLTLAEAAEVATSDNIYVTLQDGDVLCDRLEYREGRSSSTNATDTRYTDVWLTNEAATVGVFASYSGRLTCEDIIERPKRGYLRTATRLPRTAGTPPLGDAADYLELCGYCGTSNSVTLMAVFGIMIALGGFMIYGALTRPVMPPEDGDAVSG